MSHLVSVVGGTDQGTDGGMLKSHGLGRCLKAFEFARVYVALNR